MHEFISLHLYHNQIIQHKKHHTKIGYCVCFVIMICTQCTYNTKFMCIKSFTYLCAMIYFAYYAYLCVFYVMHINCTMPHVWPLCLINAQLVFVYEHTVKLYILFTCIMHFICCICFVCRIRVQSIWCIHALESILKVMCEMPNDILLFFGARCRCFMCHVMLM